MKPRSRSAAGKALGEVRTRACRERSTSFRSPTDSAKAAKTAIPPQAVTGFVVSPISMTLPPRR